MRANTARDKIVHETPSCTRLSQKPLTIMVNQIKFCHSDLCEPLVSATWRIDFLTQRTLRIHKEHKDLKRTKYYLEASFVF